MVVSGNTRISIVSWSIREYKGRTRVYNNNNNDNITSIALKSSEARAQKRNKTKSVHCNHIQEPGTYRGHHQF